MYSLLSILSVLIIISTVPIVSAEVIRGESTVPDWIKNTAGWWAEDKIHDITFVSGIQYLIGKGIIVVEQEVEVEELVEDVVEINDFYMEVNGGTCSYCVNWAYVGDEYMFQIETYDEQHGKYIDGVEITAKIISKGGELRHYFGEVTTEDGVYKNSIAIPNMDWYAGNILSVTGEYFGVEKTIEKEFEVFKNKGLNTSKSYGAGAGGCALVSAVDVNPTGADENQPHGLTFSSSGETMFVVGSQADKVLGYELDGAYCIATLSTPIKYEITGPTAAQLGNPTDIVFDRSGTKMFIVDKKLDNVFQFDLDAAWKATSATHSGTFSVTNQEKTPTGIVFDRSGTKMFITGSEGTNKGEVNVYELTEPYIITSASHIAVYTMSITSAAPAGIVFDHSGTKMFIVDSGTDSIREYALNVPYLTSSNSTGDNNTPSLSITAVTGSPRDIWFDASGTKLFVLSRGASAQEITVYELTVPFLISSATIVS